MFPQMYAEGKLRGYLHCLKSLSLQGSEYVLLQKLYTRLYICHIYYGVIVPRSPVLYFLAYNRNGDLVISSSHNGLQISPGQDIGSNGLHPPFNPHKGRSAPWSACTDPHQTPLPLRTGRAPQHPC